MPYCNHTAAVAVLCVVNEVGALYTEGSVQQISWGIWEGALEELHKQFVETADTAT